MPDINNIRRIANMLAYGMEIADIRIRMEMTDEDFFLAFVAAQMVLEDE